MMLLQRSLAAILRHRQYNKHKTINGWWFCSKPKHIFKCHKLLFSCASPICLLFAAFKILIRYFCVSKNPTFTKQFFIFIKLFPKKFRIRKLILISANKCEHFVKFSCIAIVFLLIMVWHALNYTQNSSVDHHCLWEAAHSGKAK